MRSIFETNYRYRHTHTYTYAPSLFLAPERAREEYLGKTVSSKLYIYLTAAIFFKIMGLNPDTEQFTANRS